MTDNAWNKFISQEKQKPYFKSIEKFLETEIASGKTIHPKKTDIFNALKLTPFEETKVVILGQDPYHNPNQAHGLAFSVNTHVPQPPSLRNIFKALNKDLDLDIPNHGCLENWAIQGVLLLNTVLTVEENKPNSHANIGWEIFTDSVIAKLNKHGKPIVYLLWGSHAQKKAALIDNKRHLILTAPHPSPLSAYRGFFECKHFSKANEFLTKNGRSAVNW